MNLFRRQLKKNPWRSLLVLEGLIGHRSRHRLLFFTCSSFVVLLGLLLAVWWSGGNWLAGRLLALAPFLTTRLLGLTFLLTALWGVIYLLEAFYRERYFTLSAREGIPGLAVTQALMSVTNDDYLAAFLTSTVGEEWLRRLGVDLSQRDQFLLSRAARSVELAITELPSLTSLIEVLSAQYPELLKWLAGFELSLSELTGAAGWIEGRAHESRRRERWWSRERLARIPGLAKDWSYGQSYALDEYSLDLLTLRETEPGFGKTAWWRGPVEAIETILARSREANAVVVGGPGAPLGAIYAFTRLLRAGRIWPELEHKHPKLLRTAILLSRFKDRQGLENAVVKIFDEVVRSGNIILVIDDLPSFLNRAEALGADIEQLLDSYLSRSAVQVIALAETDGYHRFVEPKPFLSERFEVVELEEAPPEAVVALLLSVVNDLEREVRGRWSFTYPAVAALAELGARFAAGEAAAEQAQDFLAEVLANAKRVLPDGGMIDKNLVSRQLSGKLGVPLGAVSSVEREKLLKLEKHLRERVVGQDRAIVAVAGALRRNRAGLRNLKRPIGSFLFLGPTGVGKTETAKALAEVFFGGEARLRRLDMSEYRGPSALGRLIGEPQGGEPGTLAKLLRSEPYGVVLLDEFEKTEPSVLDLFLQIFDEGFFSDAGGKRVDARNSVFIATTNAGAALIWDLVGAGRRLAEEEARIINTLIKEGIFKPELLNRFDAVVTFNPLAEEESREVARLLLRRFAERLRRRGLTLRLTDSLIAAVATRGVNRQFGARPLVRYIQDKLEQAVADKLLTGELKSGQEVELKPLTNSDDWRVVAF